MVGLWTKADVNVLLNDFTIEGEKWEQRITSCNHLSKIINGEILKS